MIGRLAAFATILCILAGVVVAQEDLPLGGTAVAHLEVGNVRRAIHPMATNIKAPPEERQFRYLPLLLPETHNGKLDLLKEQIGNIWLLSFPIQFDNRQARSAAVQAIRATYPSDASKIQEANIGPMPITGLRFTVEYPGGQVATEPANPNGQRWIVNFRTKERAEADSLEAWLRSTGGEIRCEYSFGTRKIKENAARVTMKELRNSSLIKKLDGMPKDGSFVYVHRDQLQQLADGIHQELQSNVYLQDPERFDETVVERLISLSGKKSIEIEASKWSEANHQSIFDSKDLAPDVIERELNKSFTYEEGQSEFKLNVGGGVGANVAVGPISVGAKVDASYSREEMKAFLKKHDVEAEIVGTRIVPKKIWLQAINTGEFSGDSLISYQSMVDQGPATESEQVTVQLGDSGSERPSTLGLSGRIVELEKQILTQTQKVVALEEQSQKVASMEKTLADVYDRTSFWAYENNRGQLRRPRLRLPDGSHMHFDKGGIMIFPGTEGAAVRFIVPNK